MASRKGVIVEDEHGLRKGQADESVGAIQARRMVDLIRSGVPADEAAREVGVPAPGIRSRELGNMVRELLQEYYAPADLQRATLRAGRYKAFLEMLAQGIAGDQGAMKLAAEWSKQIGMDPEIALNQAPQTTVNFDIGELKDVLGKLDESGVVITEEEENHSQPGSVSEV